jgi:peptide/nickel transport system ATP-binding protein
VTLLSVRGLSKEFVSRRGFLRHSDRHLALKDVSFDLAPGEILGLVGESGSGKTTLGRCVQRLIEPSAGDVVFDGTSLRALPSKALRVLRRRIAFVFQDPYASLNPRLTVGRIVGEPIEIHSLAASRAARRSRIKALLAEVGLPEDAAHRYPHQFSGGQRQRISIARALACDPDLIIADEPVSALDVSIQAQILNLLADLRVRRGVTMLFISHDLEVVRYLCDRVAVLYRGRLVEIGATEEVIRRPQHEYTRSLIAAVPRRRIEHLPLRSPPPGLEEGEQGVATETGDAEALDRPT